jgi:hypothetical protein
VSDAVTAQTVPKKRVTTRVRRFRGAILVAGPAESFELTESAAFIFRAVDGSRTVAEIGALVAQTYDVPPAEAVADATELISSLIEHQIMDGTG